MHVSTVFNLQIAGIHGLPAPSRIRVVSDARLLNTRKPEGLEETR